MTVTKQLKAEIMSRHLKVKETNCSLSNILNLSYMLFNSPTAIYPDEECVISMRRASEKSKLAYTALRGCVVTRLKNCLVYRGHKRPS